MVRPRDSVRRDAETVNGAEGRKLDGLDSSLTVEVLVCHPDWEEPQKVASMHSRPQDSDAAPTLRCDLEFPRSGGLQQASGAQ